MILIAFGGPIDWASIATTEPDSAHTAIPQTYALMGFGQPIFYGQQPNVAQITGGSHSLAVGVAFGIDGSVLSGEFIIGSSGLGVEVRFGEGGTVDGIVNATIRGVTGLRVEVRFGEGGHVGGDLIQGVTGLRVEVRFGEGSVSGGALTTTITGYTGMAVQVRFGAGGIVSSESDSPIALYIGGVRRSHKADSFSITGDQNSRRLASFEMEVRGRYRPVPRQEIIYTWRGKKLFGGFIQDVTEEYYQATNAARLHVQCVDYRVITERRTFSKTYTSTALPRVPIEFDLRTIVTEIWRATLEREGISYAGGETATVEGLEIPFNEEPVNVCFDRLAGIFGFEWSISPDRELRFERTFLRLAPRNFYDDDGHWRHMKVKRSDSQYRNRQGARTAVPTGGQRVSTLAGNGSHSYYLSWAVTGKPLINVNGDAKTVIAWEDRTEIAVWDFAYEAASNLIRHRDSQTAYTSSDEIVIAAPTDTIDVYWNEDTDEITRNARRFGGSGIVEVVSRATNVRDAGIAAGFTNAQLTRYGRTLETVEVETGTDLNEGCYGFEEGQMVAIFTSQPIVGNWFMIQQVTLVEVGLSFLRYKLVCVAREQPLIEGLTITPLGGGDYEFEVDIGQTVGWEVGEPIDLTGLTGSGGPDIELPGPDGTWVIEEVVGTTFKFTGNFPNGVFARPETIRGIEVSGGPATYLVYVYLDGELEVLLNQQMIIEGATTAEINDPFWYVVAVYDTVVWTVDDADDPADFSGWDYTAKSINGGTLTNNTTLDSEDVIFIQRSAEGAAGENEFRVFLPLEGGANWAPGHSVEFSGITGAAGTEALNGLSLTLRSFERVTVVRTSTVLIDLSAFVYEGGGTVELGYSGGVNGDDGSGPGPIIDPTGGGPDPVDGPTGGNAGGANPGAGDGAGAGQGPDNAPMYITDVNIITKEVATSRDHNFSTSYPDPDAGDVVAIWGVTGCEGTSGSSINSPSCRITVTGATTFIAEDVGNLAGASGFVADMRGRVQKTLNIIRPALGASDVQVVTAMSAASGAGATNYNPDRATFLITPIVGAATTAWTANAGVQVVTEVTARLNEAAGADSVTIDILRNGVSIFAASAGGITIPPGSTAEVSSTDFVQTPLVVRRGDEIKAVVTDAGADEPGCDAVVAVHMRQ